MGTRLSRMCHVFSCRSRPVVTGLCEQWELSGGNTRDAGKKTDEDEPTDTCVYRGHILHIDIDNHDIT